MFKIIKSFDGNKIHYRYNIVNNNKKTIVFIHGVTSNYSLWKYVYDRVENKGYNTLTFDLRGHGKSEGKNVNLKNMIKDIVLVIEKENLKNIIIVGNCLGANLAFELNKKIENRINSNYIVNPVAKNVLGNYWIPLIAKVLNALFKILPKRKNHAFEDYSEYYKLHWVYHWLPLKNMKAINWHNHASIIHEMFNSTINFDNLKKKTRIVFTEEDGGLVSFKKLRKKIKGNTKLVILKQHHFIVTRNPQAIYKNLMEFLKC